MLVGSWWESIELTLNIAVTIGTAALGVLVLQHHFRSWTNRLFSILAGLVATYTVLNYLSLYPPSGTDQLFWIRLVMAETSLIGPTLLVFALTFPEEQWKLRPRQFLPIGAIAALTFGLSLTPAVFSEIHYRGVEPLPRPGPGMLVWVANSLGTVWATILVLLKKYRSAVGIERRRYRTLLFGVTATFLSVLGITNLAILTFSTSRFVPFGPLSFLILISAMTYSIIRYNIFSIKIATVDLLVGILWVILFSNILTSPSWPALILNGVTLSVAIIAGVLLLRSLRREMEHRQQLEEVTAELRALNDRLATSNVELERFAYVASHDLQAPLRSVLGYGELLERRYREVLDAKGQEFLAYLLDGARRMQRMIESLLQLARVDTRGGNFVPVEVGPLLEEVLQTLGPQIEETQAQITIQPMPRVVADPTQLAQLFQNLIANALKFHGERPPQVTISATRREGEWEFCVRDQGIGIAPRDQERIFEMFRRLQPEDDSPGAGIGLAICKRIVHRHGGRIWVESELGKGAAFFFTIPDRENHSARRISCYREPQENGSSDDTEITVEEGS
ncbi:MAG: hypothetical protein KatS3mg115_0725 [Candidatus Poribacteria bacterium]|nr:MAG: hypothetical protein KatS3mg115_0725 [Candidatus Poribacteria bacterium]